MKYLLIGDLHLTDRPRDAYRFDIFKWIKEQQKQYQPAATIFMGDLTDKKDKHSSVLVNRIADEFFGLDKVYILMGNHDYVDPQNPFFRFLGASFIYKAVMIKKLLFIPHTHNEREFILDCHVFKGSKPDYVFCHQTFNGAIAETGVRLSGYNQAHIDQIGVRLGVYAGDIHRPQRAANVVYVGAPYHIRFGDDFDPRCILLDDDGKPKNLYFETVRKWSLTVRDASDLDRFKRIMKGDQVKLTIELAREEAVDWKTQKQLIFEACKKRGLEVFGADVKINSSTPKKIKVTDVQSRIPTDILTEFCRAENLSNQTKKAGLKLLEE